MIFLSTVMDEEETNTPFTLHVRTGPNRTGPHLMIKVPTQPNRAGSGPPMVGVPRWCSSVQLRSYCQRFATGPARFGSVLARSVNAV